MFFPYESSDLFALARRARRQPSILMALLATAGIFAAALVIPLAASEIIYADAGGSDAFMDSVWFLVFPFLLMILFIWGWIKIFERRPLGTLGFTRPGALKSFATGLGAGFVMIAAVVALMALFGTVAFESGATRPTGTAALGSVLVFLFAFLCQCSGEEILFRGWLMPVIGARYRPVTGAVISSVVFIAFHGSIEPMALLNLSLFTAFAVFYCLKAGNVWGICGWHTAWNWTQNNFFGLNTTGHEFTSGTILDLKATGARLLTGGDFGPETSIFCTLVLVAGLVWILRGARRQVV